ncbi:MAG: GTP-binding protein [Thermoplasmata archaeon]|nr:GTP-binding protein [Thermoplasmata archaeon]
MTVKKKVVLIGDSSVGKTSLVRRYVFDQFDDSYISTVGSKVSRKELSVETPNGPVDLSLLLWDLIGEPGYEAFHAWSFAGSHGAILVSDLTRKETLRSWERYWIPALEKVIADVPIVHIANKADLSGEAEFDARTLSRVVAKHSTSRPSLGGVDGVTTFLTSAKTGENVPEAFEALGRLLMRAPPPRDPFQDLFERVVAMGLSRSADRSTPMGVLDALIVDFCERSRDEFDEQVAMMLLRREIERAGIDAVRPTKTGVRRLIEGLSEAEGEYLDTAVVARHRERRLGWLSGLPR